MRERMLPSGGYLVELRSLLGPDLGFTASPSHSFMPAKIKDGAFWVGVRVYPSYWRFLDLQLL